MKDNATGCTAFILYLFLPLLIGVFRGHGCEVLLSLLALTAGWAWLGECAGTLLQDEGGPTALGKWISVTGAIVELIGLFYVAALGMP